MKKIKTLFKIDPITHILTDEVLPGSEWVINGEGYPTEKFNGTACMVRDGKLYRRYDRKANKPAPVDWEACEDEPDKNSGHWPGWIPISDTDPQDKWHREAYDYIHEIWFSNTWSDGTYELVGPRIQGNPYDLKRHWIWPHKSHVLSNQGWLTPPRTFEGLKDYFILANNTPRYMGGNTSRYMNHDSPIKYLEGIVWHRNNGDMVKIRAKDFEKKSIKRKRF